MCSVALNSYAKSGILLLGLSEGPNGVLCNESVFCRRNFCNSVAVLTTKQAVFSFSAAHS